MGGAIAGAGGPEPTGPVGRNGAGAGGVLGAGDDRPVLPRRRAPDLAGLAAFTMDPDGRVDSWPVTAERLFGHPADAVTGQRIDPGSRSSGAAGLAWELLQVAAQQLGRISAIRSGGRGVR